MIENLSGLAMGIVVLAIVIGVGVVVLQKFGQAVATCPTAFPTYNTTGQNCYNSTGATVDPSKATQTVNGLGTELDTTSGVGSWVGAIVALVIGLFFIGALMGKRKY